MALRKWMIKTINVLLPGNRGQTFQCRGLPLCLASRDGIISRRNNSRSRFSACIPLSLSSFFALKRCLPFGNNLQAERIRTHFICARECLPFKLRVHWSETERAHSENFGMQRGECESRVATRLVYSFKGILLSERATVVNKILKRARIVSLRSTDIGCRKANSQTGLPTCSSGGTWKPTRRPISASRGRYSPSFFSPSGRVHPRVVLADGFFTASPFSSSLSLSVSYVPYVPLDSPTLTSLNFQITLPSARLRPRGRL